MTGIEIFLSCSHTDEDTPLRKKLENHLSSLKLEGEITIWHTRMVSGGTEYNKEIQQHLDSAQVILLLISPDFFTSEDCWERDKTWAMKRKAAGEARVIPVLLRSCNWKIKELKDLQPLPMNGEAITSKHWSNHDDAFKEIAEEIRKAVEELIPRQLEKVPEETSAPVTTSVPKPQWLPLLPKIQSSHWFSLLKFLGTSMGVTALVVFMRLCGMLQASELWFFDQMMLFPFIPTEKQDDRLLIIEVTKQDIDDQKEEDRRGSLTNEKLFQILNKLVSDPQNQPRAIGLDIYRDYITKNHGKLSNLLAKNPRIFGVCNVGLPDPNNLHAKYGVAPPPEIPVDRLGFSDFVSDSEGLVRRQLLSMDIEHSSHCQTQGKSVKNALSFVLAQHYLNKQVEEIENGSIHLRLGDTTFELLDSRHRGGYSFWTDLDGYQVLLNYRKSCSEKDKTNCSPEFLAKRVPVAEFIKSDFDQNLLKDKIVLIGVNESSYEAPWYTPFSLGSNRQIPGVVMQAQMVSQILSAVLDKRPLLRVLPISYEIIWILFWSLLGGAIALLRFSSIPRLRLSTGGLIISGGVVFVGLYCSCLIYFITSAKYWVPFVPPALTFMGTGGIVLYVKS